jgi:hypothetical protein
MLMSLGKAHLVVRRKAVSGRHLLFLAALETTNDATGAVLGRVLVQLIHINLKELGGLRKAKGVEAAVTCTTNTLVSMSVSHIVEGIGTVSMEDEPG